MHVVSFNHRSLIVSWQLMLIYFKYDNDYFFSSKLKAALIPFFKSLGQKKFLFKKHMLAASGNKADISSES